jgi:hypothetical protein
MSLDIMRYFGLAMETSNSIEQSPSSEADSSSADRKPLRLLLEPEGSLPCSQEPAIGPYR